LLLSLGDASTIWISGDPQAGQQISSSLRGRLQWPQRRSGGRFGIGGGIFAISVRKRPGQDLCLISITFPAAQTKTGFKNRTYQAAVATLRHEFVATQL
jgi:hypothetical protein